MQGCNHPTCYWCATHFWLFFKNRMKASEREEGRSGEGSFAMSAATSNTPGRPGTEHRGEPVATYLGGPASAPGKHRRVLPPGVYVRYSRRFR